MFSQAKLTIPAIHRAQRGFHTWRMDVYATRLANYLRLKKERAKGVTKTFADLVDTNPDYLSGIERNLQAKQIGAKLARKIERSLSLPRGWMDQDHSGIDDANTETSSRELREVPEISWVQAGAFNGVEDYREKYWEHPPALTDRQVSRRAFALRVRGDSMMGPDGIGYPHGCRVIVDPAIAAVPGKRVIVKLDGIEEATFKELALDAGVYYLKPLNPRFPVMPMPEGARIVGVIVQTIIDE